MGPKLKSGAEAQKWGRIPMRGQNPKAGPKPDAVNAEPEPDAGPKPDAVNAGSEPRCRARARCGAGAQCSKCVLDKKVQEMQKQRSLLRKSARHCKAVTLIFLVVLLSGARMGT
ncbi:hypothetical protein CDL15_Pgr013162 [Punica granatum]|uniref:Uncharacterized protein n=1 Tax=Punica granatum TaxID=22663 RepID=A0A218WFI0_PUNGR|nr:hypothetical protein CDL15_Pgr013162 [Punica granatum]PKI69558.1 hypothetical protein CRG98_010041 [Punica granatum]